MTCTSPTVACIGAGNVGRAWAIVFARAGCRVQLFDTREGALATALKSIQESLADLEAAGLLAAPRDVLERIEPAGTLLAAVSGADYIQESTTEHVAIKTAVFREITEVAQPRAVVASSTSALPVSSFASALDTRERCLVVHPVNPPYLIPLVELCPAPWTAPEVTERAREFMQQVGQKPIVVRKEIPGFVLNRLQYTLVGEALHLLGEGYCDPEDIDTVLTDGLALRWALLGPLAVAHLNATRGFQGFVDQLGPMMRTVGADARPDYPWDETLVKSIHERLEKGMPTGDMGRQQRLRDQAIMTLLRWKATRDLPGEPSYPREADGAR